MKNKQSYLLGLIFVFTTISHVYAQNSLFFSTYGSPDGGEIIESIIQTSDLGIVVVGSSDSYSTNGDQDLMIMKIDVNGSVLWTKTYGGTSDDMGIDIKETSDGGFVVSGWTKSFGASGYDFWVIRTDNNGNLQWQKRIGGSEDEQAWSVAEDNNNYFVVGGTNSFGAGLTDLWAIKLDANGDIVWQKTHGSIGDDAHPGPYMEYVARGLIDVNGDYLISAVSDGVGHGETDIYLAKIDPSDGSIIWQYAYGDIDEESIWNFVESPTGGYYLPGNTVNPTTYEADLWVVYVDTSGAIQWQKTFGINSKWDEALNATTLPDGSIVMASYFEQAPSDWVSSAIKVDVTGNFVWANQYKTGHLDWFNAAYPLNDNTLVFAGVTTDTTTWDEDLALFKTSEVGTISNCNTITTFSPTITTTTTTRQSINLITNNTSVNSQNTSATTTNVTITENNICTEEISSISSYSKNNYVLYPNPTKGIVTIEFETNQPKVTSILKNLIGEEICRDTWINSSSINFNITSANGIYFLELYYDNGDVMVTKIIKN